MFSLVCVYNDEEVFKTRLWSSLSKQQTNHELIALDNRKDIFKSAASALNFGARRAHGDWIIFAHQDVAFLQDDWLAKATGILERQKPSGWVGSAGVTSSGGFRSCMVHRAHLYGSGFRDLTEVQTLDECILIHRREDEWLDYFDEGLNGWHAYGVDACCKAIREGHKNYVLPLPVWHDTKSLNIVGLDEAHAYVWSKHGAALKRICTTMGNLPNSRAGNQLLLARAIRKTLMLAGYSVCGDPFLYGAIESITEDYPIIDTIHPDFPIPDIEARAYVEQPRRPRRVIHRFCGLKFEKPLARHLVIMPGLISQLMSQPRVFESLVSQVDDIILCVNSLDIWRLYRILSQLTYKCSFHGINLYFDKASRNPDISPIVLIFKCHSMMCPEI